VGLSNQGQMRSPRDAYLSPGWRAFHVSVASFLCDQLVGVRAAVHDFNRFSKGVKSGLAYLTKWSV